jgi:hypothetical protein
MDDDTFETFVAATAPTSPPSRCRRPPQYYGQNMLQMTLGNRVELRDPVARPARVTSRPRAFASLWLDAFMHGYATARGKRGPSNLEAELVGKIPDGMEWGCEDCDLPHRRRAGRAAAL